MKKLGLAQSITLTAALMLAAACSHTPAPAEKTPIPVRTLTIGHTHADPPTRDYVGTVEEDVGMMLSFEVGGNVSRLLVGEGDRVKAGQVIATVDASSLRSIHAAAAATLNEARDAERRYGNLYRQGTLPEVKWVEVQSKVSQALSAEQVARQNLNRAVLRAPMSGVVAKREVEAGMNVVPGQPVVKLVRIDNVNINVAVPETEISAWHVGRKATVGVPAIKAAGLVATVSEIGVEADPAAHTYTVKLRLGNAGGRLMPGMVCNVSFDEARSMTHAGTTLVLPPRTVLLDETGRRFVWLAVGGRATCRTISVGNVTADGVIVTSGLNDGDHVITDGNQKVSEGMKVKVIQ